MLRRKPMKRTGRMRPRSKKRAAQDSRDSGTLEAFAEENGYCWMCGRGPTYLNPIEIHHIGGRDHAQRNDRANLFSGCKKCHETKFTNAVGDDLSPLDRLAVALAYKFVCDREYFDRELVLRIAGYAPSAVTVAEVAVLVDLVRKERLLP